MSRQYPEDDLQRAVVDTLRLSPGLTVFAIPNGGKRNPREAARMKGMGVMPGVADLFIMWDRSYPRPGILFVELKAPRGRVSEAQAAFAKRCGWHGAPHAICRSVEEVESFLRVLGAPIRTVTGGGR
jgi:VRR-NUC domain